MATWFVDFSAYAVDDVLIDKDWTKAVYTEDDISPVIKADAGNPIGSGKVAEFVIEVARSDNRAFTYDSLVADNDWEVVYLGKNEDATYHNVGAAARVATRTYFGVIRNGGVDERIAVANSDGTMTSLAAQAHGITVTNWFWQRFRVNGNSLKIKTWQNGDSEPAAWGIEITDNTLTGSGLAGLFIRPSSITEKFWWGAVGFASAGDTAPMEAPATGPATPTNLQGTPSTDSILWTWEAGS